MSAPALIQIITVSVKNMFKKYQTHFGQLENILPGCYSLDTAYDSVS